MEIQMYPRMAVNDGTRTTVATASEANPVAWNGIKGCKSFSTPVTVAEAVEAVGADYNVSKQHLLRIPDTLYDSIMHREDTADVTLTREMLIDGYMATVRDDTDVTLGVVGSRYGVVQNAKTFEFMDLLADGIGGHEKAIIETAGVLGNGERMYMTARLPEDIYLDGDGRDPIRDYILFTNSHDGSGAVTVLFTPIRVVCQNTLNMALRNAQNKLIYKHTPNVNLRLEWSNEENIRHALEILERHRAFKETFKNSLLTLRADKVSETDIMRFASAVTLGESRKSELARLEKAAFKIDTVDELSRVTKNRIYALRDTIENGIGQDLYRGTKLWLLNGLTTYFSNEKRYKTAEDKFDSITDGTDARKVNYAYSLLAA